MSALLFLIVLPLLVVVSFTMLSALGRSGSRELSTLQMPHLPGPPQQMGPPQPWSPYPPTPTSQWGQQPYGPQQQWGPAPQLDELVEVTDADITTFGDELRDLDLDVVGVDLDAATQQDYQRALDAYENAKQALAGVHHPTQIGRVTQLLEDGRFAAACVRARVAGEPLPEKRPPCFFDPSHGPSAQDVQWAPPGGAVRAVPACAADAQRLLSGAMPSIRTVQHGMARVPYWQDAAYAPWAQGYYARWQGADVMRGLAVGTLLFGGMGLIMNEIFNDDLFD